MNPFLRILILTPTAFPTVTGNASTTERWRRFLAREGHDVQVRATENRSYFELKRDVSQFKPEILHLHHASRAGELFLKLETAWNGHPWGLVVSPGGTDISLDTKQEERRQIIIQIFHKAKAIVVQSKEMIQRILESYPETQVKMTFIPKSFCWMGHETFDLRRVAHCGPEDVLFFFPAGIRPVKGNLEALILLEKIHQLRPMLRVVFAGPSIDQSYSKQFERELKRHQSFARWLPTIPFHAMHSAYEGADVVLNFSFSEGISNVLLEAKAAGKPILASDIPGNRWPVLGNGEDSPSGLLFDLKSPEQFIHQALRLIDESELRRRLGESGKEQAARLPTPEEEVRGLIKVYNRVLKEG